MPMPPLAPTTITSIACCSKDEIRSRSIAKKEPERLLRGLKFATKAQERNWLKFRLAQALRIFGLMGYGEAPPGHITVRDPIKADCFWVNPVGIPFSQIQMDDLILVDSDGSIQEESGPKKVLNRAVFLILSEIHHARPDVRCVVHTPTAHGRAYSAIGRPLSMLTQDSCAFYKDHAVYKRYRKKSLQAREGDNIVAALGNKKAVILQHHGFLVASSTIEATVFFFTTLERSCYVQLLAIQSDHEKSRLTEIKAQQAERMYEALGTLQGGWYSGLPEFDLLEAREGVKFDFNHS